MKEIEKQLKALANRRRLAIIKFLKESKEAPVTDIAEYIKLSIRSTSKHLAVLSAQDILDKEPRGTLVYYNLSSSQKPFISRIVSQL